MRFHVTRNRLQFIVAPYLHSGTRAVRLGLAAGAASLTACASTPWHEDLMTNQQLVRADCRSLAVENKKLADNAKHASEASSFSKGGAVFLAVLEGVAAGLSGTTTQAEAATNQQNLAATAAQQAQDLEARRQLVNSLQTRKSCV